MGVNFIGKYPNSFFQKFVKNIKDSLKKLGKVENLRLSRNQIKKAGKVENLHLHRNGIIK